MKHKIWYQALGLAVALAASSCQKAEKTGQKSEHQVTALDLAQLVQTRGQHERDDTGIPIATNYLLQKTVKIDGYDTDITIRVLDCIHKDPARALVSGKMGIQVTPQVSDLRRHLPFGYEVTDWDCDGMRKENDDFRLYLGEDRWHHARGAKDNHDSALDQVIIAGVPQMYNRLVGALYEYLK